MNFFTRKPKDTKRTIYINEKERNQNFRDNTIKNTKYTIYNYIFKALYEQFSIRLNQYFLLLVKKQFINKRLFSNYGGKQNNF
jgi:hypothetical protein